MAEERNQLFEEMLAQADRAAQELGLPAGFIFTIISDESWSFIIKLHAILEGALEIAITKDLTASSRWRHDASRIEKICGGLNFDGRAGKIEFALAFGIVDDLSAKYLRAVAQLRNAFAHDIKNIGRTITELVDESGNRDALRVNLIKVRLGPEFMPKDEGQKKLYVAIAAMSTLAEISRARLPFPTYLGLLAPPTDPAEKAT